MVEAHSSVGIVLYHKDLDALLFVRQFRPAVSISVISEPCFFLGATCGDSVVSNDIFFRRKNAENLKMAQDWRPVATNT